MSIERSSFIERYYERTSFMETIRAFMETIRAFMETIRTFMDYGFNGMHKGAEFSEFENQFQRYSQLYHLMYNCANKILARCIISTQYIDKMS
jgi:hypothetical protein